MRFPPKDFLFEVLQSAACNQLKQRVLSCVQVTALAILKSNSGGVGAQTWASLRQRYPKLHTYLGRIALLGLTAGSLSAVPFFSVLSDKGYGPRAHAYLAVNLMAGSYIGMQGWLAIRRRDVQAHRLWMMRLSGWMWGTFLGIRLMLVAGILLQKLLVPDHKLRLSILWNASNWVAPALGILLGDALAARTPLPRDKVA